MKVTVHEPLKNCNNLSYIGQIYIGSGDTPQKLNAIFDTGSANPWILSKEANKDNDEHNHFNPKLSPTFICPEEKDKQKCEITFGSGVLKGYFVTDQVMLGSPTDTNSQLVVEEWTFGYVTE